MQKLWKILFYEDEVVVEEYIKGREFACGVIDNEALPPIEIIPKTGFSIMRINIRRTRL